MIFLFFMSNQIRSTEIKRNEYLLLFHFLDHQAEKLTKYYKQSHLRINI